MASIFGPPRVCRDAGNFEGFTPVPKGGLCPWLQDWRRWMGRVVSLQERIVSISRGSWMREHTRAPEKGKI